MLYKRVPPSISFGAGLGRGVGFGLLVNEAKGAGLGVGFDTTLLVTGAERSGAGLGVGFGTTFFITGAGLLTVLSISGSLFSCESTDTVWEGSLSTLVTVDTFDFWLMHPAASIRTAIGIGAIFLMVSSLGIFFFVEFRHHHPAVVGLTWNSPGSGPVQNLSSVTWPRPCEVGMSNWS